MGIHGLTKLIQSKSPDSIETVSLYKLQGKKVAIDTSIFLYRGLTNIRNNGDYLKNKDGKVISHIIGIINKTIQYVELGITPIYIFDGKPPIEKKAVIDKRNKKAQESKLLVENSTNKEDKLKHEKNTIRAKPHHFNDIRELLKLMGISYIDADGEAEVYASELCRIGYVDYVVTDDLDVLPSGCPNMIRSCLDRSIKRSDVVSIINLSKVLDGLKVDMNSFIDMCILCGCDYCPTIPKVGTVRALKNIQEYKTIESYLEKSKIYAKEEFIQKYPLSRGLFKIFKDKIDINNMPIQSSIYNPENLYNYLVHECSMNEKRIQNSLQKLN